MATQPTIQPVNDNSTDLAQFKGEVTPCAFCSPERLALGHFCQWCMSRGYTAKCTNCDAKGIHKGKAVWDGGSEHASTCNPCGGTGVFPATESDYKRWLQKVAEREVAQVLPEPVPGSIPHTVSEPTPASLSEAPAGMSTDAIAASVADILLTVENAPGIEPGSAENPEDTESAAGPESEPDEPGPEPVQDESTEE